MRMSSAPRPPRGARTVVVADDDPLLLGLLVRMLEQEGHRVLSAADGRQALALIEAAAPDAVVSDLEMPHLDGWALARLMRERFPRIPMLFISGHCPEEGLLPGPCLTKPIPPDELTRHVHELLKRSA